MELPPGTRSTPSRRAVVDAVARASGAFTVLELFERARRTHPRLGLATTYRTLELLRATGDVRELHVGGRATYVRCRAEHHHHLVCVSCGSVEETDLCAAPTDAEVRRRHGFRVQTHEVDIYGLCARCAA